MRPCSLPFSLPLSLRRTKAFEEKTGYRTAGDDGRTDVRATDGRAGRVSRRSRQSVGGQRRREVDRVRSVRKNERARGAKRRSGGHRRKEPFCAQKVIPQKNFEGQIPACEQRPRPRLRPLGGESAGFRAKKFGRGYSKSRNLPKYQMDTMGVCPNPSCIVHFHVRALSEMRRQTDGLVNSNRIDNPQLIHLGDNHTE